MANKKRKEYIETIKSIREYSEREFDRLIVYLASGGLVFSSGFVTDIIKIEESTNTLLLKLSWILFTVSLIVILTSHLTAKKAMSFEMVKKKKKSDKWDSVTKTLNSTSFIALIAGLVLFVIFIINNI
ncbi:MAG: hypothetical protein PF541_04290 [Prolixibacteraceae bacterium]|nr:hypothetical protein [Prolixibacteraceae bacterium]